MDKREAIEKDIRALEARFTLVRGKNLDANKENKLLSNKKIKLEGEIVDLRQKGINSARAYKLLDNRYVTLLERFALHETEMKNQNAELDTKKESLVVFKKELDDVDNGLLDRKIALTAREDRSSRIENGHKNDKIEFAKDMAQFAKDKEEFEKEMADLPKKKDALKAEGERIDGERDKVKGITDQAKEIKEKYLKKLKDAERIFEMAEEREKDAQSTDKKLRKERQEFEQEKKLVADKSKKADNTEKSFKRMKNELSIEKQTVEIRRLRVEKIIKEKNIAEELKKLEADLNK